VVTQKGDEKLIAAILKNEPQIAIAAALEKFVAKLANTSAAVYVALTKDLNQIAKSQEAFHPFVLRQLTQPTDDGGVDGKKSTQASS
jgi:hypothetical protein